MTEILRIGGAEVELREGGCTITRYPGVGEVHAGSEERDVILAHHLLADFFRQTYSPLLNGEAAGTEMSLNLIAHEKAACLTLASYARAIGEDLASIARRTSA